MIHGGNVWQGDSPAEWLDFSANLRPEGAPEWVLDALRDSIDDTRYYPDVKMAKARRGIAAYAGVSEACVLPTSGGIAAIDHMCRLDKGRVVLTEPTFGEYARRAKSYGRDVIFGDANSVQSGDTLVLCNPNNPTGAMRKKGRVLEIADTVERAGGNMIVDEAFIDFCPNESVRAVAAKSEHLVTVGSLTKTLCIPGVRLGYVIARPETIARLEALRAPWELNSFAVAVAARLEFHLDDMREDCTRNVVRREKLTAELTRLGAHVYPSASNFLLVDFGCSMKEPAQALRRAGILVRDCDSFDLSENHIRLAVKTDEENARLIDALEKVLK